MNTAGRPGDAGPGRAGWPPEILPPEPVPPGRPSVYPPIPVVYTNEPPSLGEDLRDRLLERRVVLASGRLDDASATEVAARLMYLDGIGDDPIELRYSCPDGELGAAIALADTVELLGVELRATAAGAVGGPALLPFVVGESPTRSTLTQSSSSSSPRSSCAVVHPTSRPTQSVTLSSSPDSMTGSRARQDSASNQSKPTSPLAACSPPGRRSDTA